MTPRIVTFAVELNLDAKTLRQTAVALPGSRKRNLHGVRKQLERLLDNLRADLDDCTCAPRDPCSVHALAKAVRR